MPRVHQKKKNRGGKHEYRCVRCGGMIEPGDHYYEWSFRYGGTHRQHLRHGAPRASQLTQSKMGGAYAAQEALEDALSEWRPAVAEDDSLPTAEDIKDALNSAAEEIRQVGEEYGESADNMESAFPYGSPTIDECREKQEALNAVADALEQAALSLRDEPNDAGEIEAWADEVRGDAEGALSDMP